ncbi:MAG: zinc-ribbon domain-containing protein [Gammaproteobacteria bacterium]|nr:zinc-ribbon domain-containing protein [Gammaproteobacteria bacterium]MDH5728356.1 zinc-ribbon domain-containing protein [Gammaproteobacteria bacterium]
MDTLEIMYTECPNCNTVFKISQDQLKIAEGRVRCGRCNTVFSALATLSDEIPEGISGNTEFDEPESTISTTQAAPETTTSENLAAESDMEMPIESAVEVVEKNEALADEIDFSLDDSDESALDSDETGLPDLGDVDSVIDEDLLDLAEPSAHEKAHSQIDTGVDDDLDINLDLDVSMHEDISDEVISSFEEPEAKAKKKRSNKSDFDIADLDDLDVPSATPSTQYDILNDSEALGPIDLDETQIDGARRDNDNDLPPDLDSKLLDDELRVDYSSADTYVLEELNSTKPLSFAWLTSLMWGVLIVVLTLFLLIQFVYFKRNELAQNPSFKPWVESMCTQLSKVIECRIEDPKDISKIELLDRDVRSHQTREDALLITATMVNKAGFAQSFPNMEISFSDVNNKTIAQILLTPDEYLSKDVRIDQGMPVELPFRIMLEIKDPGEEAVNFLFDFK